MVELPEGYTIEERDLYFLVTYPDDWTMDDGFSVLEELSNRIEQKADELAIVFVMSSALPSGIQTKLRNLYSHNIFSHKNLVAVVTVLPSRGLAMGKAVIRTFDRVFSILGGRLHTQVVGSVDEADTYVNELMTLQQ